MSDGVVVSTPAGGDDLAVLRGMLDYHDLGFVLVEDVYRWNLGMVTPVGPAGKLLDISEEAHDAQQCSAQGN